MGLTTLHFDSLMNFILEQATWREVIDAKWLRRFGGSAGDIVLTLKDGAKLEMRSVPGATVFEMTTSEISPQEIVEGSKNIEMMHLKFTKTCEYRKSFAKATHLRMISSSDFERNLAYIMMQLGEDVQQDCLYPDGPAKTFQEKLASGEEPPLKEASPAKDPPVDVGLED